MLTYIAIVCGLLAIVFATLAIFMLMQRFKALTDPVEAQRLKGLLGKSHASELGKKHERQSRLRNLIWLLTNFLGRPIVPFVTWNQRRRLGLLLERAGLTDWSFAQIYLLQCVCAGTTLLATLYLLEVWRMPLSLTDCLLGMGLVSFGWWLPIIYLKRRYQQRIQMIVRQLPFFLDMVGLGLDAGLNLQASIQLALEHIGTGALHQEWSTMLADMRAGQPRVQALRQLSHRLNITSIRQLISSLIQGESMGFSLGNIIQVYADQQRTQRLMQAEKLALQAPVKMLFPMALCIFPCTFIVLGFPVMIQLMGLN